MGYRQNNPNFRGGGLGGNLMDLLPLLMSGFGGQPGAPSPESQRGDMGGPLGRGARDPGMNNPTPYVIGGGPGGSYMDEVYPGEYGAGNVLSMLGRIIGGASNVLPIPYGGLIGSGAQRLGNYLGGEQPIEGPPEPRETPIPRSVINDGWENLFLGDSEFFWNSIQPLVRAGGMRGGMGGSIRNAGGGASGAFRGSEGWGLPYF